MFMALLVAWEKAKESTLAGLPPAIQKAMLGGRGSYPRIAAPWAKQGAGTIIYDPKSQHDLVTATSSRAASETFCSYQSLAGQQTAQETPAALRAKPWLGAEALGIRDGRAQ